MKTKSLQQSAALVTLVLIAAFMAYNALFVLGFTIGPNYRNVSADARVNITQAIPEVIVVTVTDPITLNAGGNITVECNATIRDYNGGSSITNVSGVLYDNATVTAGAADDGNNHYTNASCYTNTTSGFFANFTCNFQVRYFANAGTNWVCNITAVDNYTFTNVSGNASGYNTTTVNDLLALNVTTLIDYGNMAVGDTSSAIEANVTNFGNQDINISVKGYGAVENDGLAFVCSVGNISIANERFSLNESAGYAAFTSLSSTFQQIPALTMPQQTNDSLLVQNNTFWRLFVPPNPFGLCNGTVVFQAESAT